MFGLGKDKGNTPQDSGNSAALRAALEALEDPDMQRTLGALGAVRAVELGAKAVTVELELHQHHAPQRDKLEDSVAKVIAQHAPGLKADVTVTANVRAAGGAAWNKMGVTGVKNVILVGSGKGGVGKSTVASNLALALSADGAAVGLLDADIYGPSMPTMFGVEEGVRPASHNGKIMEPLVRHGIKIISIGFLTERSTPMVWRGPMVGTACMQLFNDVHWAPLDYLVVDLPPGTGDVQLSLSQQIAVAGAVLVSTPQDVALADVLRAKAMFDKVGIPSLGLIENMSYFVCDGCSKRHEIFDSAGQRNADRLGVPLLAALPLETPVRVAGDKGTPVVVANPNAVVSKMMVEAARLVALKVALAAVDAPREEPPPAPGKNPLLRVMA